MRDAAVGLRRANVSSWARKACHGNGKPIDEEALKEAKAALAIAPRAFEALWARARALESLGRGESALRAYAETLLVDPSHFDVLTAFGSLAIKVGRRDAAKTAFAQAVAAHERRADGHVNFAMVLSDEDPLRAQWHFETALRLDPANDRAHGGLAILFLRRGESDMAERHALAGSAGRAEEWPFRGNAHPISVLVILSALGPNVPIDPFIDDRVFQKWTLAAELFDKTAALPPHDVVFNGIGDADRGSAALNAAERILAGTLAPVLNAPARVRNTGRAANARRLGEIEGVVTARMVTRSRASLLEEGASEALASEGFTWPILLRLPGFHMGEYLVKVDGPGALRNAVCDLPGETVLVIQFLDTRGDDGRFRKFRVMVIGGLLYPLHLAVSVNWKVHYFSADMADRPEHRGEDEAFLQDMPRTLGDRAIRSLQKVQACLGLDYGGIDFALDRQGNVVVFDANATMAVVAPGQAEFWSYRATHVEQAQKAVHTMLIEAGRRSAAK